MSLRVIDHPLRVRILGIVDAAGKASPSEIHAALAKHAPAGLGHTSYHVRELVKAGLLKPSGTRQVRGAVEHFYSVDRARAQELGEELLRVARVLRGAGRPVRSVRGATA